jgi:hypothetical protein
LPTAPPGDEFAGLVNRTRSSGFGLQLSPIYRALFCSRVTSSPGEGGQHSHAGYLLLTLFGNTMSINTTTNG